MIRRVNFCLKSNKFVVLKRQLSAQAAVSFKPSDEDFVKAIPFEKIPGPGKFEHIRSFMPGGSVIKN